MRIERSADGFGAALADGIVNRIDAAIAAGDADRLGPDVIVRPLDEAGVARAVREAAAAGQRVAVRSGGHSWVAATVRGDGVLLDLGALDHVEIDADARTARIGPAVRGKNLSAELEAVGLAFPVGHCGDPGVGGYLLGGGLGVNWGQWKPACFSITRMRVVRADGEAVTASATENPDLFWLARGSGPLFPGVVTEFELALHALPRAIRVSTWEYPLDRLGEVTGWLTDASARLPANVEVSLVTAGRDRPGATDGPGDAAHPLIVGVAATVFADDEAEARAALGVLGDGPGGPIARAVLLDVPFSALHEPVDATYPDGARYLADTFFTHLDLHEALKPIEALMRSAPPGHSYVLAGMPANGAGSTLLTPGEAAFAMHDTTLFDVYVIWDDPADDAANRAWLDAVAAALLPTSTGHFISEADIRHRPERIARSFRPADRERIDLLRARFDPHGVFHTFPRDRPTRG